MNKTEAYCNLLDLFGRITHLSTTKLNKNVQAKKNLGHEMMIIGMNIALLGSDDVIKNYINWRAAAQSGDIEKTVKEFSNLMLEMRRDLRNTEIKDINRMTDMFIEVKQ